MVEFLEVKKVSKSKSVSDFANLNSPINIFIFYLDYGSDDSNIFLFITVFNCSSDLELESISPNISIFVRCPF